MHYYRSGWYDEFGPKSDRRGNEPYVLQPLPQANNAEDCTHPYLIRLRHYGGAKCTICQKIFSNFELPREGSKVL